MYICIYLAYIQIYIRETPLIMEFFLILNMLVQLATHHLPLIEEKLEEKQRKLKGVGVVTNDTPLMLKSI